MAETQLLILYISLFSALFFEVFILITYLEVREELKREKELLEKPITHYPTVSIIVPCWNEEKTLAGTVKSLLNLEYPKDKLSIILVDDGSTDSTPKCMQEFKDRSQIKILSKENGGKYTALNYALEHIDTDLVGCLDADSFVDSNALRNIVPFFNNDAEVKSVIPSIRVFNPNTVLEHGQKIEYSLGVFMRRMLSSLGALYVTPGPFSIFRRTVFKELGGYKLGHQTEDMELALRLQKHRYKIVKSDGAVVFTVVPTRLLALLKQRVRWSYGFLNNVLDYKEMFFNKKYGNLAFFVMPLGTLSIFTTLYIAANALSSIFSNGVDAFIKFRAVGFGEMFSMPSLDWYFINTGMLPFISITILLLTILIITVSIYVTEGRLNIQKGILYYMVLYIFIVPMWLAKSTFNTLIRREISWR